MGNFSRCRSCGKQIMFIRTKSGRNMPVDSAFVNYRSNPGGRDRVVLETGEVVACDAGVDAGDSDGYGYISHFATCPNAGKHRR